MLRAGTLLNTTTHRYWGNDHTLGHNYDYGDPTIRYLPSDGHFYIVPSTPLRDGRSAGVPPSPYPCCFVQWVSQQLPSRPFPLWHQTISMLQDGGPERSYASAAQVARSKDLMTWTDGKNQDSAPFMGWPGPHAGPGPHPAPGVGDTTIAAGSVLDVYGSAADKQQALNKT